MRGCFPHLCFVLCPMPAKKETYQQARAAVWLVCIHLLPNGGQGCFSKKNVLPSPTRHCGLKGVTCLHRKGALITYHIDRQRRQQREPRGSGISELLGRNPIFCQGEFIFHHLYLSLSETLTNQLNSRNIPRHVSSSYLLHTVRISVTWYRHLWYRCSSSDNKSYKYYMW